LETHGRVSNAGAMQDRSGTNSRVLETGPIGLTLYDWSEREKESCREAASCPDPVPDGAEREKIWPARQEKNQARPDR